MTFEQGPTPEINKPDADENEQFLENVKEAIVFLREKSNLNTKTAEYEAKLSFLNGVFDMISDVDEEEWLEGLTRRELDVYLTLARQKREGS